MTRLKPEDVALLKENQSLVDHLFEKTISLPCYLTLYHRLTKDVKPVLEKIGSLPRKGAPGLANDWATEESFMMDAIRPYVRDVIKGQSNLDEDDICRAISFDSNAPLTSRFRHPEWSEIPANVTRAILDRSSGNLHNQVQGGHIRYVIGGSLTFAFPAPRRSVPSR
jgi:hypothetical protein